MSFTEQLVAWYHDISGYLMTTIFAPLGEMGASMAAGLIGSGALFGMAFLYNILNED